MRSPGSNSNNGTSNSNNNSTSNNGSNSNNNGNNGGQNKIMRSIVSEQPRIQQRHHHVESFWTAVMQEMGENNTG